MNLPNKITMARIFLTVLLLVVLMFPYGDCNIHMPIIEIGGRINLSLEYLIGGVIFLIASITDSLDGNIARKRGLVTDFGKVMDAIADKVLVNGILIVFACNGVISPIIPVIIILRDTCVDSIKMVAGQKGSAVGASKLGKLKTICMMSGLTLTFFSNLPFELISSSIRISDLLLYVATILSIVSGIQYFIVNKEALKDK